jgi:hypothetical protein
MKRDRFQCTYCATPGTDAELEVDHIIPVARGGSNHMSNLTTACRACNQKKGSGMLAPARASAAERQTELSSGPIGIFLHTLKGGEIDRQGQVIAVDDDTVLIQLFSWLDGRATKVVPLPRAALYSDACVLYAERAEWIRAAECQPSSCAAISAGVGL